MFRRPSRLRCALWLLTLTAGCQPVREDRSVNFDKNGDQVAFQHGDNGVFVADKNGGPPKKIFQPAADVVATSTPLWCPTDGRLIFTTAKRVGADVKAKPLGGEGDPAGRFVFEGGTIYTCWLRGEEADGKAPEPVALFEAACDHLGYVSANLAVRWHPDGKHVLFVQQTDKDRHGVFEFDIRTKKSRPMFAQTADALVFDWAPDDRHLVCILGGKKEPAATDGVWVGKPGADDWWHVPESGHFTDSDRAALLEKLRATRLAWSRDGRRFAFVSSHPLEGEKQLTYTLHLGTLENHAVEQLAEEPQPVRDLRWSPDGERLGYVVGAKEGPLRLVRLADHATTTPAANVRVFVGWDAPNARLAYVAADPIPNRESTAWVFLLATNPGGRDAVWIAPADGSGPGAQIFSGMQVTFPQWSPNDAKLSLWATFNPAYRSGVSLLLDVLNVLARADAPAGANVPVVRRGDPALLLDAETGALDWKAVNARELYQLGNYELLRRNYDAAWQWYDKANRDAKPEQLRESLFYQYYCLTKLNRTDEAKAKLAKFERDFLSKPAEKGKDAVAKDVTAADLLRTLADPKSPDGGLVRDFYIAEVFLSLDASDDGETYFRDALKNETDGARRLNKAVLLSQFLLLRSEHREYADLAGSTLLPLLLRQNAFPAVRQKAVVSNLMDEVLIRRELAVLPLCDVAFVKTLDDADTKRHLARLLELRGNADSDVRRLWLDLMIRAAHERLGAADEAAKTAKRIADNPAQLDAEHGQNVRAYLDDIRQTQARMEESRQFWQLFQ
jgi:hypothetical protein